MQRGYIAAVTLAALAAVFLQGCGKNVVAPAIADTSTTLTAPIKKGTTVLQVANTVGFYPNSKVVITDPTTKKYEANVISAVGSITLMGPVQNDYPVGATILMPAAGAGTVTSLAQAVTSGTLVASISPLYITESVASVITLTGKTALATGDAIIFAADCSTAIPNSVVTLTATDKTAKTATATVTVATAGAYKLCYRSAGKLDSVEQTGVATGLTVTAKTNNAIVTKILAGAASTTNVAAGTATILQGSNPTITLTTSGAQATTEYAWVTSTSACPLVSDTAKWTKTALTGNSLTWNKGLAAGIYNLCVSANGKSRTKQTAILLNVKNAATCGGGADGIGGTNKAVTCPTHYKAKSSIIPVKCDSYACAVAAGEADNSKCCEAANTCTVPTIAAGVGSMAGTNCASGATNVAPGTTCTITAAAGYTCTSPGACAVAGTFAATGACTACAANCQSCDTSGAGKCDTCKTGYTVKADKSACEASCDASKPITNGAAGTCTNSLASGATCQPTCNTGYTASGTSSCLNGALTAATCTAVACTADGATAATAACICGSNTAATCTVGQKCTVTGTNGACAARLRLYSNADTDTAEKKPEAKGFDVKPMLFGAAGLVLVSLAVMGVKHNNRDARSILVSQEEPLESMQMLEVEEAPEE